MIPDFLFAPDTRPFPLYHGYWVPGMDLVAGEYPGAREGRPEKGKLATLRSMGVTAFVDLTEPHELPPYRERMERIWGRTQVQHHRFAIPDLSIPSDPMVMASALDHIQQSLNEGHRIYLHCMGGVGRTGLTVACLLTRNGLPAKTALDVVASLFQKTPKRHRRSPETPEQRDFVLAWPSLDPGANLDSAPDRVTEGAHPRRGGHTPPDPPATTRGS